MTWAGPTALALGLVCVAAACNRKGVQETMTRVAIAGLGTIGRVLAGARPGAVVLMHDGYGERAQSVAALLVILAELARQGYRFTIPA